ncbi:hypothetical protein ACFFWD_06565 [Bradyrhizobium erythrophlei]|uniref:hypothetical protein n=1 Tax=Bradyrhizobium erythrophlei TaxID=1437360 RepID=UPI0035EBB29F
MNLLPDLSRAASEIELASDATSLDFLQAVYRDEGLPLSTRMRAAIAALPFERPKLAVIANVRDFAAQMEAAQRARGMSPVIDAKPNFQKVEVLKEPD